MILIKLVSLLLVVNFVDCATKAIQKYVPPEFNVNNLPWQLKPLAFMVGRWRSDLGGKVRFRTIPTFTYGEQVDVSIAETPDSGPPSLNYTSHAWGTYDELLHGESGFLSVKHAGYCAATLTMQNGFVTLEEGRIDGHKIEFRLRSIGRLHWSRDLPVLELRRYFTLLDDNTLEQLVMMRTLTQPLQEHTRVRYTKLI